MKYRVRLDLAFNSKEDAQVLIDFVKTVTARAVEINPGTNYVERPMATFHECLHDEGGSCKDEVSIL